MLRFLFTKTPLNFLVQSFWRDEAFSYLLSKHQSIDIILLTAKDFNPPLYYLLLHYWMRLFGNSEIAIRSLSMVFYWATAYMAFLFLMHVFKLSLGKSLVYLTVFLLNPLMTYYAFEARMYTLFTFLAVLSFYAYERNHKKLFLFSTILGLYTHYFMIFIVFSQLIHTILVNRTRQFHVRVYQKFFIVFVAFAPWIFFLFQQKNIFVESFWIEKSEFRNWFFIFGTLYTGFEKNEAPTFAYLNYLSIFMLLLVLLAFVGIRSQKRKGALFSLLFLWGVAVPIFIYGVSFLKPVFIPKYLIAFSVGFFLFVIYGLEQLEKRVRIIFVVLLILFSMKFQSFQLLYRQKINMAKTIHEIRQLSKPRDVLYVMNELDFHTAKYYFDEERVFIYHKFYDDLPNYIGKVLIPKEKVTQRLPLYPSKAFLLYSNGAYDIVTSN